jgi:hypothetical protein
VLLSAPTRLQGIQNLQFKRDEPVREISPQQDRVLLHGRERKCQRSERAAHDRPGTEAGGLDDRIVQVRERSGRGARVRVVVHLVD